MESRQIKAGDRSLIELLKDVLAENPDTGKIVLVWEQQEENKAPDFGLTLILKAAAQDGAASDIGVAELARNYTLEGGDGSANSLSELVLYIPGGLGLITQTRKAEEDDQKFAERLEDELDEDCEIECRRGRHKMNTRAARLRE